jgi:hypothetical protein
LLAIGLAALPAPAAGQADRPDRPLAFAPRLVAAINGKDLERRRALMHPRTLACVTPQTRPYFEEMLASQFRHTIPASHRVRAETVAADRPLSFGKGVEFPLRPTHEVHIDYETGPHKSTTIIAFVAYTKAGWREVGVCMKPEIVPRLQAAKEAREKQEKRVQWLAANMPQDLRADVLRLVAAGRKIDAIREFQNASGEDLSTARSVVELITPK